MLVPMRLINGIDALFEHLAQVHLILEYAECIKKRPLVVSIVTFCEGLIFHSSGFYSIAAGKR
jgi:hypothetical protein